VNGECKYRHSTVIEVHTVVITTSQRNLTHVVQPRCWAEQILQAHSARMGSWLTTTVYCTVFRRPCIIAFGQFKVHVLRSWDLANSAVCERRQHESMKHTVDTYVPLTEFVGGLQLLVDADDDGSRPQWPKHSRDESEYSRRSILTAALSTVTHRKRSFYFRFILTFLALFHWLFIVVWFIVSCQQCAEI